MIVLRALGSAEIQTAVTTLTPSQEIVFAAALYLVLERGKRVSRTALATLLWPHIAERTRAHRLRQTILQLKKLGIIVTADRDNLQLPQHDAQSDVDELSADDTPSHLEHDSLEFLPGYSPRFSESLRDWVDTKRGEIHAIATKILVRELDRARLRADWSGVEKAAAKCLSLDSLNEAAVLAQAEAAAMRGGKQKAVSILDRYIAEVGRGAPELKLPATLLRRRVVERIPDRPALLNADPPFVGRETEMEALSRSFTCARTGNGSATLLIGEPGIGKSRLSAELGRFAELQGATVQRATCRRTDLDRPLSLFVDIVPQLREMPGALGCEPETFTWLKRLTEFEQRSADNSRPVDSQMLFQNVRAALFDLLDSVAEERCLVILIEDIQWLDDASAKILARVVEWCESKHLLLLMNSRPTNTSFLDYTEKTRLAKINLGPLPVVASTALLQSIALRPGDAPEPGLVEWCLAVAEGNPFFLQELANQWIETGRRHEAPPSVTKVLQERLSRLSSEALQVLQTCAVLGEHATLDRVERVLEYHPHQLLSAVEDLSKGAMLSSSGESIDAAGGPIQPRHDFLSAAALGRLAPVSRAFIHRRSGEVLEKEFAQQTMPTTLLWACANHFHLAGDRERARTLSMSCAEHLLEVGLAHDACTAFHRSLEYCFTDDQRLTVLPRLAFAFQLDGEWQNSQKILRKCIELNTKGNQTHDSHNEFELLLLEARYQSTLDFDTVLHETMACVESQEATPSHRVRASVLALKIATDFGTSATLDTIYQQVAPFLNDRDVKESNRLEVQMVYRTMCGDRLVPREDLWRYAQAVRLSDGEFAYSRALLNAASACRMGARYSEGLEFLSMASAHALSQKLHSRFIYTAIATGRMHIAARCFDKAKQVLVDAHKSSGTSDNEWEQTEIHYLDARIALEEGDLAKAAHAISAIGTAQPTFSVSRAGHCFALDLRLRLMQGAPRSVIEPLVTKLEATNTRMRGTGSQDFESYSLYLGLTALGEQNRATTLLRDYVELHRREKWPLAPQIRNALNLQASA